MKRQLIALLLSGLTVCVFADRVTLKSGSILIGKAGALEDGKLSFASDDLGDIKIDVKKIAAIESEKTHVIQYQDNRTETVPLTVVNGAYVVNGKPVDEGKVKKIDPVEETWHGNVNVAFQADRGNSYDNSATVTANLNRRWEKDRLNFDFSYSYKDSGTSSDDAIKSKDEWLVKGQHDHFWAAKIYHYERGQFENDVVQGLNSRFILGVGVGYQWLDGAEFETTGKWSFSQELGLGWTRNNYREREDGVKDSYCNLSYAHHLTWQPKWSDKLSVFHNLTADPNVADWDTYTIETDLGLSCDIYEGVNLLAKMNWAYNSKPSTGCRKSDLTYILGLGYKW